MINYEFFLLLKLFQFIFHSILPYIQDSDYFFFLYLNYSHLKYFSCFFFFLLRKRMNEIFMSIKHVKNHLILYLYKSSFFEEYKAED